MSNSSGSSRTFTPYGNVEENSSTVSTSDEGLIAEQSSEASSDESWDQNIENGEQLHDQSDRTGPAVICDRDDPDEIQFGSATVTDNSSWTNENTSTSNDCCKPNTISKVTNNSPVHEYGEPLNLKKNERLENLPDTLAAGCIHLMEWFSQVQLENPNQSESVGYQIDLSSKSTNPSLFQLSLYENLSQWYYRMMKNGNTKIQHKAEVYIEKTRQEFTNEKQIVYDSNTRLSNKNRKRTHTCRALIDVNETEKECGFYVIEEDLIVLPKGLTYFATARSTGYRIITISPRDHCSNSDWLTKPDTWKFVFDLIDYLEILLGFNGLPIYRIFANFGSWNSQVANDGRHPDDGHAHINLVLTNEAISACKYASNNLSCLENSNIPPINYRLMDADELGTKMDYESKLIQKSSDDRELDEELAPSNPFDSCSQPYSRRGLGV